MKIRANGIEVNCRLSGEGECIVLIHGFGDNLDIWHNQEVAFAGRYRTLAYDVRGFGQTKGNGEPYSIELFAGDLYELLRALDIKSACIVGFSMGGRIAVEFALAYPEVTKALILANTGVGAFPKTEMESHRKIMAELLKKGNIEAIADMTTRGSFSRGFAKQNPAVIQRCKEIRMQNDPSDYLAIMEAVDDALDATPDMSLIKCPTLIITGENDTLMGEPVAQQMKDLIENAELKILPTGHASALEAPESFNNAVLDFMDEIE